MVKKLSALALAGLLAMPIAASAGAGGGSGDLAAKIDQLSRELNALKAEMSAMKEENEEAFEEIDEKAEGWDMAARFKFSGDFRTMAIWNTADSPSHYTAVDVSKAVNWFTDPVTTVGTGAGGDPTANGNNVAGSQGEAFGSHGMLTGFFAMDPSSPTFGDMAASAGAAGFTLSQVLFGDGTSVDNTGAVDPLATPLSIAQRTENLVGLMKNFTPAQRAQLISGIGYNTVPQTDYDNDTLYTNRLRLNMRVKATENVEFKGRFAMYKAWGMQNNPVDYTLNGGPHFLASAMTEFDGARTRQPNDSALYVDRAFVNWNNIGGQPVWFSIGRRPTSDGPPAQLRLGADKRMATPPSYMDYPFDGFSLGYAYNSMLGLEDFPGRVRFCYGRGFESGPTADGDGMKDVDFAGISWDVYKKGDRFLNIQSFGGFDIFNVPDGVDFPNPIEFAQYLNDPGFFDPLDPSANLVLDRKTMGNIYYSTLIYMDKIDNLNYFFSAGWSRTDPRGVDELGTGLLTSWWDEDFDESKDGVSFYVGTRYDMPDIGLKLGLEYNYGNKNWIAFTPGHDDLYQSKLATRGSVYEAYLIYDLPTGEAISKFAKTFIRVGYQHYDYDYTGSGFWLGEPIDIDDLADDPLNAQFYAPVEEMDNIYVSFEAFF